MLKKNERRTSNIEHHGIDQTLIEMFQKLAPEERIMANDNAVNAIRELQNAFKQRKKSKD